MRERAGPEDNHLRGVRRNDFRDVTGPLIRRQKRDDDLPRAAALAA
jgi:hypothetical protein